MRSLNVLWLSHLVPYPPKAGVLYALEIPEGQGDTCFADMFAAYEALPPQYQELLQSLKDEVTQAMIDKYEAADAKNLPAFEASMEKVVTRLMAASGPPWLSRSIRANSPSPR